MNELEGRGLWAFNSMVLLIAINYLHTWPLASKYRIYLVLSIHGIPFTNTVDQMNKILKAQFTNLASCRSLKDGL